MVAIIAASDRLYPPWLARAQPQPRRVRVLFSSLVNLLVGGGAIVRFCQFVAADLRDQAVCFSGAVAPG